MRIERSPLRSRSRSPASWRLVAVPLLLLFGHPGLATAHGDDTVTAASFYGPLLTVGVILLIVPLGKALLRLARERR